MANAFPNSPAFSGPLEPVGIETSVSDLEIEGDLPKSINGTWIRVQPDPLYPPMLGDDIFFNGDGVISRFQFNNGKVDFMQRRVDTERVQKQREAGKSLFGKYRNPYTNDPSVSDKVYSTANTNVIRYQDKLLALKEDNLPYALDPETLDTLGVYDFEGQFTAKTCTSHPKVCAYTGNLVTHSYCAKGEQTTDMAHYEFNTDGKKVREAWFHCPFPPFMHDMAITENYVVYVVMPFKHNVENGKKGGMILQWDPQQDMLFGIMRRDGDGSDIRWMSMPNGFPGHTANSFEENGKVYLDLTLANDNVFPFFPDAEGNSPAPQTLKAAYSRVELDPQREDGLGVVTQVHSERFLEFPRFDERLSGKPYRYSFHSGMDIMAFDMQKMGFPHDQFLNLVAMLDLEKNTEKTWYPGPTSSVQESTFIPRSDDAPEADGYLIVLVNRLETKSTDLVVIDTAKFEEGPVATIKCPIRMRVGLHGNWVGAA